jgi:antirestriction protein ArdC
MEIPVNIKHGASDRAFYTPTFDYIQMPNKEQFKTEGEYYSTLVHEVIHSTGHKARLNRLSLNDAKFDSKKHSYSYEELVAELGASYLTAMFGVATEQTQKNSAAYLQGWLSALKADKQMLYKASADAQKAVDYIVKKIAEESAETTEMSAAA